MPYYPEFWRRANPEPVKPSPGVIASIPMPDGNIEAITAESEETACPTLSAGYQPGVEPHKLTQNYPPDHQRIWRQKQPPTQSCPEMVSCHLLANQTTPEGPDVSPEVEITSLSNNPVKGLLKSLVGSMSPIPVNHRGTRPRKQPERYAPVKISSAAY